jgi:hypothetical protein
MSIGLVLRHTYQETCEICEQIAHYLKVVGSKFNALFTRVGYARAASELARQGYYEEAKALMLEKDNLK